MTIKITQQQFRELVRFGDEFASELVKAGSKLPWAHSWELARGMSTEPRAWLDHNQEHAGAMWQAYQQVKPELDKLRTEAGLRESIADLERATAGEPTYREMRAGIAEALGVKAHDLEMQRIASMSNEERAALAAETAAARDESAAQKTEDTRQQRAITAAVLIGRLQASGAKFDAAADERLKAAGMTSAKDINEWIADKRTTDIDLLGYDDAALMVLVSELTGLLQQTEGTKESFNYRGSTSRIIEL